jgi:hypothetical protein
MHLRQHKGMAITKKRPKKKRKNSKQLTLEEEEIKRIKE